MTLQLYWRSGSSNDLYATRLTEGGSVLDTLGVPIPDAMDCRAAGIAGAYTGSDCLLIWEGGGCYSYDVFGIGLSADLVAYDSSATCMSMAARDQRAPAAASDGINHLVVWQPLFGKHGPSPSPDHLEAIPQT